MPPLLRPVQQGLLAPSRAWDTTAHYFAGLDEARAMQARAERQITAQAERVMRSSGGGALTRLWVPAWVLSHTDSCFTVAASNDASVP